MIRQLALVLALLPAAASAQAVRDCDAWITQARNIAEPWEEHTATFANGDVRIAVMDAIEPGAVPFHLMVLTPPRDELGARVCRLVSLNRAGFGFANLTLDGMERSYDPTRGLTLTLQAAVWSDSSNGPVPARLTVTVNQATGQVTAALR